MKTVYKYVLDNGPILSLDLPAKAIPVFFTTQQQRDLQYRLCLWIERETAVPPDQLVKRAFQIFGTGHFIPDSAKYIGSCLDGPFVWHCYEVPATSERS